MIEFTPCMVLTTVADQKVKQNIIQQALSKKLAACIQEMAIHSHYIWQDSVCQDDEILLIIKTQDNCYTRLEQLITTLHDYDTPQIVRVPIVDGSHPYLTWLKATTDAP